MLPINQNLEFLKSKIMQVKTGLCCIECDCFVVKAHIIEALYLDNIGNLYFTILKPLISDKEVKNFPVTLTFYRKIYDYYVQLTAEAVIENYQDGGKEINKGDAYFLIKAKILDADYVEHKKPFASHKILTNIKDRFYKLSKAVALFFF